MGKMFTFDKRAILTGNFMHKVDPIAKEDPLMGKLFGSKPAAPPPAAPPAVMPVIDDEAVRKARTKAVAAAQQRGGRASTILTDDPKDKLG
jgi:hypothetical protein